MARRYFTIAEANAMLPDLTRLIEQMMAQGQQMALLQEREAEEKKKVQGNGHHNPAQDRLNAQTEHQLESSLRADLTQLQEWGIELKDLSTGLLDFPAMREGRVVYLCWQYGEPEVAYWHEIAGGFSGRQPLDDKLE